MPEPLSKPFVTGVKQTRRALAAGRVLRLYTAADADPALTEPLAQLARESRVPVETVSAMAELGRACGIAVGAAVAAALTPEA